ncbi:15427_t:CDS:1, partial [Racocetra fulgida]
ILECDLVVNLNDVFKKNETNEKNVKDEKDEKKDKKDKKDEKVEKNEKVEKVEKVEKDKDDEKDEKNEKDKDDEKDEKNKKNKKDEKNGINANLIRIYGDVVHLSKNNTKHPDNHLDNHPENRSDNHPNNLEINLSNFRCVILIVARRFEIEQGCQITINYRKGAYFQLFIYAKEMPTKLVFTVKNKEKDKNCQLLINASKDSEKNKFQIDSSMKICRLISLHIRETNENLEEKLIEDFEKKILSSKIGSLTFFHSKGKDKNSKEKLIERLENPNSKMHSLLSSLGKNLEL